MSNNKEGSELGMAVGLIWGLCIIWAMLVGLVLTFITFVLTIMAFMAWNEPLTVGSLTITPQEARAFVKRGLVGAWMVPTFCCFVDLLPNVHINWDYLPHLLIGGYVAGSLGIEYLIHKQNEEQAQAYPLTTPQIAPSPAPNFSPEPTQGEFRFATWDDEEERA
jgi:hypothetical protein